MLFTARSLRTAIRSTSAAVGLFERERLHPTPADTPRSPQRPTFEAALRVYLERGRRPGAMVADYDRRRDRAKRREAAGAQYENGRRMITTFLGLDAASAAPTEFLVRPTEQSILGHRIRLGYDLVYSEPEGVVLRQLLTDDDIRRDEHLRLFAAASLLHFETAREQEIAGIDIWQLRFDKRFHWPRWRILRRAPMLGARLDEVVRVLGQDAA